MLGIHVNPATLRPGDKIATKTQDIAEGVRIIKTRDVKRVETCSKLENVHVDGECYDTRFSTVVVPA